MIFQYWDDPQPPGYVQALLDTIRERNPDLEHRVFSRGEAERFIAAHLSERERAAFNSCAVPAMQADYLRYCAGLVLGGVYSDVDFRCAAPLRPLLEKPTTGEVFFGRGEVINGEPLRLLHNRFFAFKRAGHPFLALAVEIATANIEERVCERVWRPGEDATTGIWMTAGPGVFTFMHLLNQVGSFDRVIEVAAGTPAEPFMDVYCQVIGDPARVAEAYEGMKVSPSADLWQWVAPPEGPLAWKETDSDWRNITTPIFH